MANQPPPYNPAYPPQQSQQPPYPSQPQEPLPPKAQQAYPPQPQQQPVPATVVTVQQPVATVQAIQFRDRPVTFTDSSGQQVTTQLEFRSGTMTWLIAGVICFFTGLICLAPIPFCIDGTKDVYHINPRDGSTVGVYKRGF